MRGYKIVGATIAISVAAFVAMRATGEATSQKAPVHTDAKWEYATLELRDKTWYWSSRESDQFMGSLKDLALIMSSPYGDGESGKKDTSHLRRIMNIVGKDGWELVAAENRAEYIFKRPAK